MGYNISEKVPMPRALNLAPPQKSSITGKSANHPLEMDLDIAVDIAPLEALGLTARPGDMTAWWHGGSANWRHDWRFNKGSGDKGLGVTDRLDELDGTPLPCRKDGGRR